ncbi:HAD family hydrolase [Longispora albida]|uniref:HAD family hydrolase n=1 Tax=Longispora albida TaxID=203523 RepID=UPI0003675DED|nr:HAD family hydrolase [Longispora albida]
MTPRLVALDLDGTVVPYAQDFAVPSERVRKAIARAIDGGAVVTVATGRAVWNALPTARALGLAGIELVCSNGAVGYDLDTASVIFRTVFDPGHAARVLAEAVPDAGFAVEYETQGYLYTSSFVQEYPVGFLTEVTLEEMTATPTSRMICRLAGDAGGSLAGMAGRRAEAARVAGLLSEAEYGIELGYSGWIDVTAPGVSKASGLATLAGRLGIAASECAVIGDGSNDLPMFAWAGHSVAMGQATETVKAAAHEVTGTVAEDGVAMALERWF